MIRLTKVRSLENLEENRENFTSEHADVPIDTDTKRLGRSSYYIESVSQRMAKYSTGGGVDSGDNCELCGATGVETSSVNVAGAQLEVCTECAQHDDSVKDTSGSSRRDERKKRAAQNTARMHDATKADSSHWENGADYDDDQLPYLVSEYDEILTTARQDAGYQLEELATELDIDESDVLALEQGRAIQANVGGSVVYAVEEFLDISLVEE